MPTGSVAMSIRWNTTTTTANHPGTAGKPILGAIQRLELTNTVVVMTRYFGGKKLGVRGLIEAYGQCATLVLKAAGTILRVPKFQVILQYPYAEHSLLLNRLQQVEAEIITTDFAAIITLTIAIPESKRLSFQDLINEMPLISIRNITSHQSNLLLNYPLEIALPL